MEYTVRVRQTATREWMASAEGMPGCAVKADSRESALEEMKTAINMYVSGLLEEAIDDPGDPSDGEVVTLSV